MTNIYTTSSIGAFQACPRLYNLRVNRQLESVDRPPYFALGSLFHKAKEEWLKSGRQLAQAKKVIRDAELSDEDIRMKAYAMIMAYDRRWKSGYSTIEYHAIEKEFICQTEKGVTLAGICDGIVLHDGRWWILETKTASALDDAYINRMGYQRQALLYTYAIKRLLGDTLIPAYLDRYSSVVGVLYDFIQKPTCKRKKATASDKRRYTKNGELYKGQRERDESDIDYLNRMHDWYRENGMQAMRRVEVVFTDSQLDAFVSDLHNAIDIIEMCRSNDAWPMSLSACHAYNRPCEFNDYCRSGDSAIVLRNFYRKREKKFAEFEENIGGENDSITTKGKDKTGNQSR